MKTYPTDRIRNVAIVGHGHSGKTTLTEALLFASGTTNRIGRIEDGNTVTDFDPDETDRKFSISLALAPIEWKDYKLNILDAPGYADFFGDAEAAMSAADAMVIVVDAVAGVQVQTRAAWDYCERHNLPRIFYMSKLDRDRADYHATLNQLVELFGAKVTPLHLPVGSEHDFKGVVDLLEDAEIIYTDGKPDHHPLPEHHEAEIDKLHVALIDSVVEADEDLMIRYLAEEPIDQKEIFAGMHKAIAAATTAPVLCGSAPLGIGVDLLLDFIVEEMPAPQEHASIMARRDGQDVVLAPDPSGPLCAQVFKTLSDPFVGRLTYFRVYSGTLKPDTTILNTTKHHDERLGSIFTMRGKSQDPVPDVVAGDIGVAAKLTDTVTGDTLSTKADALVMPPFETPEPVFHLAIRPKTKGDEDKLSTALAKIVAEDPSFHWERNPETHQTIISGMGETHLDIIVQRLHRQHVEVETFTPRIAYRETIRGVGKADGQVKKQTGGRGQFARCSIELSPQGRGEGYEFEDAIVGGAVPHNFIPSVDKGARKAMEDGPLAGYPFVDCRVKLVDGKYHDVDSSDIAFQIAAGMAFKDAAHAAGLVLLEPIMELSVIVPDDSVGDIMGDLSARRGRLEGTEAVGRGWTRIKSHVPQGEIMRYATDLRSKTGGRGTFSVKASHYDEAPPNVQERVVAETLALKTEGERK